MQLAIIADIHGNLVALEKVLAEIAARGIEHILCLGDVAAGGPQPREVLARVRDLKCPVVMGNRDAYLLQPISTQPESSKVYKNLFFQYLEDIEEWGSQQLDDVDRDYIRTFHTTYTWELPQQRTLLAYHGSPRSFNESLLATTPDEKLAEAFGDYPSDVFVGGHTHVQMFRRYLDRLVLNPGSIGMAVHPVAPFESIHNVSWAEYSILHIEQDNVRVDLCSTPFDIDLFCTSMIQSGMPHAEWWAHEWRRYFSPHTVNK